MKLSPVTLLLIIIASVAVVGYAWRGLPDNPNPNANLLFKSSFEEPIYTVQQGNDVFLHGEDQGFEWYGMLNYSIGHMFNTNGGDIGTDVDIALTNTRAKTGTRSLGLAVYTAWDTTAHRAQLDFYTLHADYPQLFIRKWLWLQPDLEQVLPDNKNYHSIIGHREVGPDFGVGLAIWKNPATHKLEWYASAGYVPAGEQPPRVWEYYIDNVPVPLGSWFKVESFIKRDATDGIFKVWINGQLIVDVEGQQTMNSASEVVHNRLVKIYTDATSGFPYYSYMDDLEIWDAMP